MKSFPVSMCLVAFASKEAIVAMVGNGDVLLRARCPAFPYASAFTATECSSGSAMIAILDDCADAVDGGFFGRYRIVFELLEIWMLERPFVL